MPRVIRESGDRLTSSGNFLQNLIAWLTFLVDESDLEQALNGLLRSNGRSFVYKSPRTEKRHKAVLAFEGDDTLGKLQEDIRGEIECFMERWGWKPKLKYFPDVGPQLLTFVGYNLRVVDGRPVLEEDEVVCFPELRRALTTKQWTLQDGTSEDIGASINVYAKVMSEEFKGLQPMHALYTALAADTEHFSGPRLDAEMCREIALRFNGEIGRPADNVALATGLTCASFQRSKGAELLASLVGTWTPVQWSLASGLTSLKMTGADLRSLFIPSWL
jgi:hypothetical protein